MKPLLLYYQLWPFLLASRVRRLENLMPTTPPRPLQRQPTTKTTQSPPAAAKPIVYEVCTSPACVADGAYQALERLQALAPPHVIIQPGSCSSLCGNGPVISVSSQNTAAGGGSGTTTTTSAPDGQRKSNNPNNIVRHRKVTESKILELLYPENQLEESRQPDDDTMNGDNKEEEEEPLQPLNDVQVLLRERRRQQQQHDHATTTKRQCSSSPKPSLSKPPVKLVQGYNLVVDADAAFAKADYETAVALYGQAVDLAFATAMDLQQEREHFQHHITTTSTTTAPRPPPVHLEWLIRARRNDAICKLKLGYNIQDALFEAQAACNLSKNTCAESFRVLADIYHAMSDLEGERQALTRVLELPVIVPRNKSAMAVENERRELKFRLEKIQRDLLLASSKSVVVDLSAAMSVQEGLVDKAEAAPDEDSIKE